MSEQLPVKIPRVARTRTRRSAVPLAVGLALLGTGVFAKLVTDRDARAEQAAMLPPLQFAATTAPPVAPAAPPATLAVPPMTTTTTTTSIQPSVVPTTPFKMVGTTTMTQSARTSTGVTSTSTSTRASPTLIIDLAQTARPGDAAAAGSAPPEGGGSAPVLPTVQIGDPTGDSIAAAGGIGAAAAIGAQLPTAPNLPGNDGFSARVGGSAVEVATAQRLTNLNSLVPQGAIIGAVLETALNTDLPGYARAIVTRDVLSFDGSTVLIPAGSRVIGQYNSGVAQGASRIFIVWSRLIREDGVSIALGSPAVDDLGRGGLRGKVNRHFLQRFGGAILLSVLTGGIQAAAASVANGNTVVVNSATQATSLAGQASQGTDIPPTITTKQGANVRIFVARDLDFSTVGPAAR